MPSLSKRIVTFIDGQNLYMSCKEAFDYSFPNYDVNKLSEKVAKKTGNSLSQIRFYTGIPDRKEGPKWHGFWSNKLAIMGTRGVHTFSRQIRYQEEEVLLRDGTNQVVRIGHEKGIDVRLALDVVRLAIENAYDIAVIFSQDQDLSEAVDEVALIAKKHKRDIRVVCAYPVSSSYGNKYGINGAIPYEIDKAYYDECIDPIDYRPKDLFNPIIIK